MYTTRDGTMKTFSRWRLFPVDDTSGYKIGKSLNTGRGVILKLLSGPDRRHLYKVEWRTAEGTVVTDETKKNILTQHNGQRLIKEFEDRKAAEKNARRGS
jgi:hypothetical protein